MIKTNRVSLFLSLFILFFTAGHIYAVDQHILNKKPKVVTVSVQPLDELQIYNDTAFSMTIVVHDTNNDNITYQVTLAPGETFYKNTRCRTAGDKKKLAKLLLFDVGKQNTRMLMYPMRTQFDDETWHSITVKVSEILNK